MLEVGCGQGQAAELICSRLETGKLLAIDRSESGVDRTKRRCASYIAAGRLAVRHIDLATLRVPVKRLDKVFAFNVNLFWVREAADEVALLHERVVPGGAVYLFYEANRPELVPNIVRKSSEALARAGFRVSVVEQKTEVRAPHAPVWTSLLLGWDIDADGTAERLHRLGTLAPADASAEVMQDDSYLIAADGWKAETYRIIEKDKKGKDKDKGWTCDLIPKPLIVARHFAKGQAAIDQLTVELASKPGNTTILATFDRTIGEGVGRLAETIAAATQLAGIQPTGLAATAAEPGVEVRVADAPVDSDRVSRLRLMLAAEARIIPFSTLLADPTLLTGERRLSMRSQYPISTVAPLRAARRPMSVIVSAGLPKNGDQTPSTDPSFAMDEAPVLDSSATVATLNPSEDLIVIRRIAILNKVSAFVIG